MRSKTQNEMPWGMDEAGRPVYGVPANEDIQGNEIADIAKNHVMFKDIEQLSNVREPMRINIIRLGVLKNWSIKERSMFEAITGAKFDAEYRKWRGNSKAAHAQAISEFRDDNLKTLRSIRGVGANQIVTVLTRGMQWMKRKLIGR